MAYNIQTAQKVRTYLSSNPTLNIEEKKMFGGLAFMVNGKMCINVSGDNLMCRFDSKDQEEISLKSGFKKMIMKGREYQGYCYVEPEGFEKESAFSYWMELCLDFNAVSKSSKK